MQGTAINFGQIQYLRSYQPKLVKVNLNYHGAMTKDDSIDIAEFGKLLGRSERYRFGVYYTYESLSQQ